MDQRRLSRGLDARLSRRATMHGVGAIGLAGVLAAHRPELLLAQEATPVAGEYPEVVVTATEHAFDVPATIDGGWTMLTLDNQGQESHHAFFLRPNADFTIEDIQAALESPEIPPILEVAVSIGGMPTVEPGERASVLMNLAPGQYVLACATVGDEGVPHFTLGMQAPVEVGARAGNALPPFAETRITLVSYAIEGVPAEVSAGSNLWEVLNDGDHLHELRVWKLAPGVTFETVQGMIGGPPASPSASPADMAMASPMASPMTSSMADGSQFVSVGGVGPMSPGNTVWSMLELEAGDHVAACFIPDYEGSYEPHAALGMLVPFTVT